MKRLLFAILMVLFLTGLYACGQDSTGITGSTSAPDPIEAASNPNETVDSASSEATQSGNHSGALPETTLVDPYLTVMKTETYQLSGYGKTAGKQFHDGVAWAALYDETIQETFMGVINKNGELLYRVDKSKISELAEISGHSEGPDELRTLKNIIATPFINGLSVIYLHASWANSRSSRPGFIVVNSKGEEIYTCFEDNVYICGQTSDGKIIATKHDTGFADDSWSLCVFDESLGLIETGIKCTESERYDQDGSVKYQLIADDLYYGCDDNCFFNLKCLSDPSPAETSYEIIKGSRSSIRLSHYDHIGDVVFIYFNRCGYVPISALCDVKNLAELKALEESESFTEVNRSAWDTLEFHDGKYWHGGSFLRDNWGKPIKYIDLDGNILFDLPSFPDGVRYKMIDDFSGGYAALYLVGVDGNGYVTLIDGTGNIQYDPVQCRAFKEYTNTNMIECESFNGYIFMYEDQELHIINPQGESVRIGDNFSSLSGSSWVVDNGFSLAIGEDYMYVNTSESAKYVSLDGKSTIESVVAKYNDAGQLLYTGTNGLLTYVQNSAKEEFAPEPVPSDGAEKNYASFSNFSIEGKWKNVGTYTFGQVQSGAIIAFDGTNCNFYSPKDTYAFYKDGDRYKLECTSLLAETLSFTVKIVDKNNVDVFVDSDILELTRVE